MLATTESLAERGSPTVEITEKNKTLVPARRDKDGRTVGISGLGQSVVALPLYHAGTALGSLVPEHNRVLARSIVVGWTNPIVTAAGAVLVLLLALLLRASLGNAVFLALLYGLATYAWPHSKTFFSEPLATTLILASVYFAVRGMLQENQRAVILAGAFAALALFGRSSIGLFIPFIGLYLVARALMRGRSVQNLLRATVPFAVGFVPVFALFLCTNWWRYGDPFDLGYTRVEVGYPVLDGLRGMFLSSGKSLFLYAPVVAVALVAAVRAPKALRPEIGLFMVLALANTVFFAGFLYWHGDHAWGPRYLVMSLPFYVLPLAPLLGGLRWRRAAVVAGGLGLVSALLGTVVYHNQYFLAVAREFDDAKLPNGDLLFYEKMRHTPYWSPVLGHIRFLPDVARNTVDGLDGTVTGLGPFVPGPESYGWYFEAPPTVDSWVYWIRPAHGPHLMWVFVPVFGLMSFAGLRLVRGAVRQPAADDTAGDPPEDGGESIEVDAARRSNDSYLLRTTSQP